VGAACHAIRRWCPRFYYPKLLQKQDTLIHFSPLATQVIEGVTLDFSQKQATSK
jgi:hypothetical protein